MHDYAKFYIDGEWVEAATSQRQELIDPTTEEAVCHGRHGDR